MTLLCCSEKYFDRAAGKWMYDDAASGLVYEYDDVKKAWEPTLESLQAAQAKAYSVQGVDEEAPADTVLARENKRKKGDKDQSNNKRQKKQGEPKEKRNTAIYVKGLPLDATVQEVEQEFSKAGIILGTPEPKIKLYETNGQRNGDGLIVYLQEPSADLACQLFDGAPLRYGGEPAMSVERAKFEEKAQNQGNGEGATASGSGSSARKGGRIKSDPEKAAAQKQAEKLKKCVAVSFSCDIAVASSHNMAYTATLHRKLEGWESDDEVEAKARVREAYKEHKVVILKHMFTLQELADRPEALLEIKEDVREECEALGEVTNVVLYDVRGLSLFFSLHDALARVSDSFMPGAHSIRRRNPRAS